MTEEALPPQPALSHRMRRFLWVGIGAVVFLITIGLWLASRPPSEQLQGEVDANDVNVATKALARVDKLLVEEGDRVRKGQVLAILAAPEIENGRRQADAALASARALESISNEGLRPEDMVSLRSTWLATQATADLAAITAKRAEHLFAEGVIAAQRRDEARAARDSSARIAQAAKAQYDKAQAGTRLQNRMIARSQVDAAEAGVSTAQVLERETRLIAPIDGEVARRLLQPGEIVSPILPAFQLIEIDRPWVTLNVRENDYRGMSQGRFLIGVVPALGHSFQFRVAHVSPQGSFATWRATRQSTGYDVRAFEIKLKPVKPIPGLRPGMSVLFDWPQ